MATSEREVRTAYMEIPRWGLIFPLHGRYPCLIFLFFGSKATKNAFKFIYKNS